MGYEQHTAVMEADVLSAQQENHDQYVEPATVQAVGELALHSNGVETPILSPAQLRHQQVVMRLLEESDFTYHGEGAGRALARELGFSDGQWAKSNECLKSRHGITYYEMQPGSRSPRHSRAMGLSMDDLLNGADNLRLTFITDELLETVKERLAAPTVALPDEKKQKYNARIEAILAGRQQRRMATEQLSVEIETSDLSPTQKKYETVMLRLLKEPDLAFRRPNASRELAHELGLTPLEWDRINQKLHHRYKAITFEKADDGSRKPETVGVKVNIEGLLECAMSSRLPFVSKTLLTELKNRLMDDDIDLPEEEKTRLGKRINSIVIGRAKQQSQTQSKPSAQTKQKFTQEQKSKPNVVADKSVRKTSVPSSNKKEASTTPSSPRIVSRPEHKPKKPESKARQDGLLNFRFHAGNVSFSKRYELHKFKKLTPIHRLLLAIGHSSNFAKTKESQADYSKKLINKGMPKEAHLNEEQVQELLQEAVVNGYVCEQVMYAVQEAALDVIRPTKARRQEITSARIAEQEICVVEENALVIRAVEMIHASRLPVPEHRVQTVKRLGYRMFEVLAELELAGGTLHDNQNLAALLGELTESDASFDSYTKAINALAKRNFIELSTESGHSVTLTPAGRELIADIKAHDELIPDAPPIKLSAQTSYLLIEVIMEQTQHDGTSDTQWMFPEGNSESILPMLAERLGMKEDTLTRRMNDLKKRGSIDTIVHSNGKTVLSNIRVTEKGVAYAHAVREKLREEEGVIPDEQLAETDAKTEACIQLADRLGDHKVVAKLRQARDAKHLAEMQPEEFAREADRVVRLLGRLVAKSSSIYREIDSHATPQLVAA